MVEWGKLDGDGRYYVAFQLLEHAEALEDCPFAVFVLEIYLIQL